MTSRPSLTRSVPFWILIAALVFRAMPHITLVSGYLLPFFQLNIWGVLPTTPRVGSITMRISAADSSRISASNGSLRSFRSSAMRSISRDFCTR